jgi:hypothetical protein
MSAGGVCAAPITLDNYQKRATNFSEKRFSSRMWDNDKQSTLTQKRFPFKKWDKHFSPLGSKRAPIALKETRVKKRYKTRMREFPKTELEIAEWDSRVAKLQRKAQISTDDTARVIADKQLYYMALQSTRQYEELGVELSLRDINRYQFRRNHQSDGVPVRKAGAE